MKKVLLYNVMGLAIGCVLLELTFGGWFRAAFLTHLNIPTAVTYTFRTDTLYQSTDGVAHYHRDQYGLRGHYTTPFAIDILTVGGSTTDQRYLDDDRTWQAVLVRTMRERGKEITVVNAGIDGQSTVGHLKDFALWFPQIPHLQARYVLLYIGGNDLFAPMNFHNDDLEGMTTWKGMIKAKSVLYHLYRTLRGVYLAHVTYPLSHRAIDFSHLQWTDMPLQGEYKVFEEGRVAAYAERLRALNVKVRAFGAVPIFVAQPLRFYKRTPEGVVGVANQMSLDGQLLNGMDCYHLIGRLVATTMHICREAGGICLDLAGDLAFDEGDFYDYFHNTPTGAQKIGRYLGEKLSSVL